MPKTASTNVTVFSRSVVAPVVAVVVVAFALVVWMLFDIARNEDAELSDASVEVVERAWTAREDELTRIVGDYAAWGAAYENLHIRLNRDWAYDQDNLGRATAAQFNLGYIFVMSPAGPSGYSFVDGKLVDRQPAEVLDGDVDGLIGKARLSPEGHPVASVLTVGDDPVIVVAAAVTPGSDPNVKPIDGPSSVLLVGQRMTSSALADLAPRGFLSGLRLVRGAPDAEVSPSVRVGGADTAPLRLRWEPARPGDHLIKRLMPWLLVAAVALSGFILLMLLHAARATRLLEKSSMRLSEAYRDADHQAHHDQTTGLPNRAMLAKALDSALSRPGARLAALYLDLDRFKPINDTYGHPVGDVVLAELAERLRQALRDRDFVARVGGDEFVVVAPYVETRDVEVLCQRLMEAAKRPFVHDGATLHIGLSAGVALAPLDAEDGGELIRCADIALYQAKASGRDAYRFFSREMNDRIVTRAALEADIRNGLEAQEFFLVFQPRYDTRTLAINGVEALLRWRHPVRGVVAPAEFVPLAEDTGLIAPLGAFALRQACEAAIRWRDVGVSVNVSPVQFRSGGFPDLVREALARTGLEPRRLELELTEGVLLEDTERAARILAELKEIGVGLSLDDFGTGYSSLGYLKSFPFDTIKIDRTFVSDLQASGGSRAIVQAILGLGRALGMKVTAEGVETPEQLLLLKLDQCSEVQGFHLARPLPVEALNDLLVGLAPADGDGDSERLARLRGL